MSKGSSGKPRRPPSRTFLIDVGAPPGLKAQASLSMARLQGCDCDPDITEGGTDEFGIGHFTVHHDSWCSLMRSAQAPDN